MRTKALFLTVALSAAGIATSMAQVYSVNAVGYVNVTIPGGKFALLSNPLIGATNTINALFPPTQAPLGAFIYTIVGGGFQVTQNDAFGLGWLDEMTNPAGDTRSIGNGEGFFFWNPDPTTPYTITFVGEVAQGNPVSNPIPINFSMRGSKVPQTGLVQTDLGFPSSPGDLLQKFDVAMQRYDVYSVDPFASDPATPADWYGPLGTPLEPTMAVAEGAIVYKPGGAKTWNRNFTVN